MVAFEQPIVFYLTIPTNATTGARIVLDGINGFLLVYDATNHLVGSVSGKQGADSFGNLIFRGITDYDTTGNLTAINLDGSDMLFQYINPGLDQNSYFPAVINVSPYPTGQPNNASFFNLQSPSLNSVVNGGGGRVSTISLVGTSINGTVVPSVEILCNDLSVTMDCQVQGYWHVNGEAWKDVVFQPNWSNLGAPYRPVRYKIDALGRVVFVGAMQFSGLDTAPSFMFILPAAYRPDGDVLIAMGSNQPSGDATPAQAMNFHLTASTGLMVVTNFSGTINPGPVSLEGVSYFLKSSGA